MKAEIVAIGTELLLGHILNSNTAYISRQLAGLGIDVFYHTTVGDNKARLKKTVQTALKRSDIVFTIGGLGPTEDDITVRTISEATHIKLEYRQSISKKIDLHFKKHKIKTPRINYRQAYIPKTAKVLENAVGTAPGLIIKVKEKTLISLPGPPRELMPMFEKSVAGYLKKNFPSGHIILSRLIKTTGLPESSVCPKVEDLLKMGSDTTLGIYAHLGQVDLKITAKAKNKLTAKKAILPIEKIIRRHLGSIVFGADSETLESVVGGLILKHKKTLSVAESCTGGLIANRITSVPGSSKYFSLGITAYSNQAKKTLLNVPGEVIDKNGAVSRKTAIAMAKGIKDLTQTHMAIGITGIAGPTGGSKKKPIGTVFIALVTDNKTSCQEFHFLGPREDVKFQASQAALNLIRRFLL